MPIHHGNDPMAGVIVVRRKGGADGPPPTRPIRRREPNGRWKRETVDEITALAAENRRRFGLPEGMLRHAEAGSVFGRMHLTAEITDRQYRAGLRWCEAVRRYARLMDLPFPTPRSLLGTLVETTGPAAMPPPGDEVAVRAVYDDAFAALLTRPGGRRWIEALRDAVILDRPADLGDLRCGLNTLAQLWK